MYYTQYKGIYYRFYPKSSKDGCDIWQLSDQQDDMGNLSSYNADIYRIDQCIDDFIVKCVSNYNVNLCN